MARKGDGVYLRKNTWWLDCIIHGRRYQISLGKGINRSAAVEIAGIKRAQILQGEVGIGKPKDISFNDATDLFLKWLEANKKPNTLKSCKSHMKKLKASFGGKKLSEISQFLIEKHKIQRIKEGSPISLNRELAYLKWLYTKCIDWKKYKGENPVVGIKRIEESEGRTRSLTKKEEARLLAAAKEPLRTIILMGIYTGLRVKAEILSLKWENIDLERGYLTVEGAYSKNHDTVTLPLSPKVLKALKAIRKTSKSDHVFINRNGNPYKSIRTTFTTTCCHAKISDVTPHVLRHTFATRLMEEGFSDGTVQVLGRWKEPKMVRRYTHVSNDVMKKALNAIAKNSPSISTTPPQGGTRKSLCARSSVG